MTDHVCLPVYDGAGNIIAHALVAPDLSADARLAVLELVAAARRGLGDDPEAAARQEAAVRRVRERVARLRGQEP